ncbi:MAG: VOC family protein [Candidatus Geothermincolia bacterium]
MFVEKIDHIGIAVKDARRAHDFLTGVLGATFLMEMEWGDFVFASYGLGSASMLELIHSSSPEHFINRFIEKRGEGIHHVTLKVKDIQAALAHCRASGIEPFDVNLENPMWKEAFIHPRDALGILVQLAEFPEEEWVETWKRSQQGILANGAEGI